MKWFRNICWLAAMLLLPIVTSQATEVAMPPGLQLWLRADQGVHWASGTQGHLRGEIAEILVFNRALALGEQRQVEEYLQNKFGFFMDSPEPDSRVGPFPVVGHRDYPKTVPLLVGTEDGVGPLSLPVLDTCPLGVAHVFDAAQPDLFVHADGGPYRGISISLAAGRSGCAGVWCAHPS